MEKMEKIVEHKGRKFYATREAAEEAAKKVGGFVVEEKMPAEENAGRVSARTGTGRFYVEVGSGVTYPR